MWPPQGPSAEDTDIVSLAYSPVYLSGGPIFSGLTRTWAGKDMCTWEEANSEAFCHVFWKAEKPVSGKKENAAFM